MRPEKITPARAFHVSTFRVPPPFPPSIFNIHPSASLPPSLACSLSKTRRGPPDKKQASTTEGLKAIIILR
ncbi:hypothetical protein L1887_22448 [Cichorium endivia]|nr:hypothetical protein L1887_22448 [Cichorium endivia]